eukprot:Sdes_comp18643_c0_seq2m8842
MNPPTLQYLKIDDETVLRIKLLLSDSVSEWFTMEYLQEAIDVLRPDVKTFVSNFRGNNVSNKKKSNSTNVFFDSPAVTLKKFPTHQIVCKYRPLERPSFVMISNSENQEASSEAESQFSAYNFLPLKELPFFLQLDIYGLSKTDSCIHSKIYSQENLGNQLSISSYFSSNSTINSSI